MQFEYDNSESLYKKFDSLVSKSGDELDLSNTNFSEIHVDYLVEYLNEHYLITKLNLRNTSIGEKILEIARVVTIKELNLANSKLSHDCLDAFIIILKRNRTLNILDLSNNGIVKPFRFFNIPNLHTLKFKDDLIFQELDKFLFKNPQARRTITTTLIVKEIPRAEAFFNRTFTHCRFATDEVKEYLRPKSSPFFDFIEDKYTQNGMYDPAASLTESSSDSDCEASISTSNCANLDLLGFYRKALVNVARTNPQNNPLKLPR